MSYFVIVVNEKYPGLAIERMTAYPLRHFVVVTEDVLTFIKSIRSRIGASHVICSHVPMKYADIRR